MSRPRGPDPGRPFSILALFFDMWLDVKKTLAK
jgi:hypothetical protein